MVRQKVEKEFIRTQNEF